MFTVTGAFVVLTLVLLIAVEIGYRFAMWNRKDGGSVAEPEKITETFVLTLLSLILAFTLSAARASGGREIPPLDFRAQVPTPNLQGTWLPFLNL